MKHHSTSPLSSALVLILIYIGILDGFQIGHGATLITFDDLSPGTGCVGITNGYGGLEWSYFCVLNPNFQNTNGGYYHGRVSVPNVAANQSGNPAFCRYYSGFNLNSAYLTAQTSNGLPLRVQGFVGNTAIYDQTNVLDTTGPTFINFNFLQVDRVTFTPPQGTVFVMDNLSITSTNAPVANFFVTQVSG